MLIDELLTYLFDGQSHLLAPPMATWLNSSRRFIAFVDNFRDKIRKKIRTTQDQESLLDLRLELETAHLLHREKSLSVEYEPQRAERIRHPDFAVNFTTSLTFMVEVTRLRVDQKSLPATPETDAKAAPPLIGERLGDAVCSKLGQMMHQKSNVLIAGVDDLELTQNDIRDAWVRIQQRAERSEPTFLQRYRFRDRTEFFHHYQRLSELIVRGTELKAGEAVIGWINPQAKYPLPSKVRTALYRSHIHRAVGTSSKSALS